MNNSNSSCVIMLIIIMIIFTFNTFIGGWAADYILNFFGKDIPFYADCIIGFFIAEILIPIAIILWIISLF